MGSDYAVEQVGRVTKGGDKWELRWTEVTRTRRVLIRRDRGEVTRTRDELLAKQAETITQDIGLSDLGIDGSSTGWNNAISEIARRSIDAAQRGDRDGQERLATLAQTVARLSSASLPHRKIEELEAALESATDYIEEMRRLQAEEHAPQYGAGRAANPALGRDNGAREAVCRPRDPIPAG